MHAWRAVLPALLIKDLLGKDEVCVFRGTHIRITVPDIDDPVIVRPVVSQDVLLAGAAFLTFIIHPGKLYREFIIILKNRDIGKEFNILDVVLFQYRVYIKIEAVRDDLEIHTLALAEPIELKK